MKFQSSEFIKTIVYQHMGNSTLEKVPCALEKNVYSAAFGWNVLYKSIMSIWPNENIKLLFLVDFLSQ